MHEISLDMPGLGFPFSADSILACFGIITRNSDTFDFHDQLSRRDYMNRNPTVRAAAFEMSRDALHC